jgi:LemA protein
MLIALLIVVIIVAVIVIWLIAAYNGFITLRNRVEEAFATIDVYLKKRYDLIPNLVETVKGYAAHERQTLSDVIEARNQAVEQTNASTETKIANENMLTGALGRLFALAENYPILKADTQFLDLQRQLQVIETDLAQARKYYNANVKTFNTKREVFPSNIVASMFKFKPFVYFQLDSEAEKENVKVDFSYKQ